MFAKAEHKKSSVIHEQHGIPATDQPLRLSREDGTKLIIVPGADRDKMVQLRVLTRRDVFCKWL